ncbi:LysR family transcriptional regulator [Cupriavidus basilensis]
MMYRLCLPITRDLANARQQLMQREEQVAGSISIGMVASETESVLVGSLVRFNARYPNVEVSVADGFSATLIDLVSAGQLDAAVVHKPRGKLSLHVQSLHDEEMVLVTSAEHGPEPAGSGGTHQAARAGAGAAHQAPRLARRAGCGHATGRRDPAAEVRDRASLAPIVQFVEATRFATVLPRIVVQRAVDEGRLRMYPILAPRIVRHLVCVSHPQRLRQHGRRCADRDRGRGDPEGVSAPPPDPDAAPRLPLPLHRAAHRAQRIAARAEQRVADREGQVEVLRGHQLGIVMRNVQAPHGTHQWHLVQQRAVRDVRVAYAGPRTSGSTPPSSSARYSPRSSRTPRRSPARTAPPPARRPPAQRRKQQRAPVPMPFVLKRDVREESMMHRAMPSVDHAEEARGSMQYIAVRGPLGPVPE